MIITLEERTAETVRIFFEQSEQPIIRATLPRKAQSVEEALADYRKTLLPDAKSFGRIIRAAGKYVGDVWCYGIDLQDEPNAMLSYCLFDTAYWNKGIATKAVALFLDEVCKRYALRSIGAFTFADNAASLRVLEKNGFRLVAEFTENGRASRYYQYTFG